MKKQYKNLVFDVGGVLLFLPLEATIDGLWFV